MASPPCDPIDESATINVVHDSTTSPAAEEDPAEERQYMLEEREHFKTVVNAFLYYRLLV